MAEFLDSDQALVEKDIDTGVFKATEYFENYLFRIIESIGGEGADTLNSSIVNNGLSVKIPYLSGRVNTAYKEISSLQSDVGLKRTEGAIKQLQVDTANFRTRIETTTYTAVNNDYVEGRSGVTIKLPANAKRSDQVMVANGDGSAITVDGNGNDIKFTSTDTKFITSRKGSSYHFHYFIDNGLSESYWRII